MGRDPTPLVIVDSEFAAAARADQTVEDDVRRKWKLRDVDATMIVDHLPVAGAPRRRRAEVYVIGAIAVLACIAFATLRRGSTDEAAPVAEPAKAPAATPARPVSAVDQAYQRGIQLFARGATTQALATVRQALAAAPDHAPSWRLIGLVHERLGETDQARFAYRRYLELAPDAEDAAAIRARLERS